MWTGLGINAGKTQLQCGYIVDRRHRHRRRRPGTLGNASVRGSSAPRHRQPWWYAVAICDNDGDDHGTNATFATAFNTTVVSAQNEHK